MERIYFNSINMLYIITGVAAAFCIGFLIAYAFGDSYSTDVAQAFICFVIAGPFALLFSHFLFYDPNYIIAGAGVISFLAVAWLLIKLIRLPREKRWFGFLMLGLLWGCSALAPLMALLPYLSH